MLDTIGLNYSIYIEPVYLQGWDEISHKKAKGGRFFCRILTIILDNGAPITYTYFPYADKGKPILKIEFSLPHVVFGSNVFMISNLETAIDQANKKLPYVNAAGLRKLSMVDLKVAL